MTTQLNYDADKFRVLGVGESTVEGDWHVGGSLIAPEPLGTGGWVVTTDDHFTYLRPIRGGAADLAGLAETIGIKTDIGRKALEIALANIRLLDSKQQDYGSENIAAFGEYGVLVRTWDKVSRLKNLLRNVQDPKNESLEDSWVDLSNYAVIALLCRRGLWK